MMNYKFSKLIWWVFIAFIIQISQAHSQTFYGVQGGVLASSLRVVESGVVNLRYNSPKPMTGFNINAVFLKRGKTFFGFSAEPGILLQRMSDAYGKLVFTMVNVPLLAQFYFRKRLSFSLGPEISMNIFSKRYGYYEFEVSTDSRYEVAGTIGVNYEFIKNISIGGRFSQAFNSSATLSSTGISGTAIGETKFYHWYSLLYLRYVFSRPE